MKQLVTIRASVEHVNGDGTVVLGIDSKPLTNQQHKLLDELFPDLQSAVEMLLLKQAVLHVIGVDR